MIFYGDHDDLIDADVDADDVDGITMEEGKSVSSVASMMITMT